MSNFRVFIHRSLLESLRLRSARAARYHNAASLKPHVLNCFALAERCSKSESDAARRRYTKYLAVGTLLIGGSLLAFFKFSASSIRRKPKQGDSTPRASRVSGGGNGGNAGTGAKVAATAAAVVSSPDVKSASSDPNSAADATVIPEVTEIEKLDVAENVPDTINRGFPDSVPYLLIGGGTASFAAFRAIKYQDATAKVLIVSQEPHLPYMRPPLSKELWFSDEPELAGTLKFRQWNGQDKSVFFEEPEFFCDPKDLHLKKNGGVAVLTSKRVVRIDVERQIAHLDDGSTIGYRKCLIATGGRPRRLTQLNSVEKSTTYFRSVGDYHRLEGITSKVKSIVVIGGGFLGSELAYALAHKSPDKKLEVIQTFPEKGVISKVLPEYLSKWTMRKVREEGVRVIPGRSLQRAEEGADGRVRLWFEGEGQPLVTDHVVVAAGIEPNVDLAIESGLEVDDERGGFRVNAELEARHNVWVAGDAACFYDVALGRRRVEHHDHAVVSGRLAGENMTGAAKPYTHQSMFWSDIGPELGFEAIGLVSSDLVTVSVFAKAASNTFPQTAKASPDANPPTSGQLPPATKSKQLSASDWNDSFERGVVFYCKNETIVGMVLWNIFDKMHVARQIMREHRPASQVEDLSKLFNLYEERS